MKKIIAIVAAMAMALALAACSPSTMSVETDDTGIHVVATNGSDGAGNGTITIEEGHGLCVNHILNKGSFQVTVTDTKTDEIVFDKELTDNIADFVPVTGDFEVIIEGHGADGTIDIIAYDVEAQAQADASLDDTLDQIGVEKPKGV